MSECLAGQPSSFCAFTVLYRHGHTIVGKIEIPLLFTAFEPKQEQMSNDPPPSKLVSASVVARHLGVSARSVTGWANAGRIPHFREAKSMRFDLNAVLAVMKNNPAHPPVAHPDHSSAYEWAPHIKQHPHFFSLDYVLLSKSA